VTYFQLALGFSLMTDVVFWCSSSIRRGRESRDEFCEFEILFFESSFIISDAQESRRGVGGGLSSSSFIISAQSDTDFCGDAFFADPEDFEDSEFSLKKK